MKREAVISFFFLFLLFVGINFNKEIKGVFYSFGNNLFTTCFNNFRPFSFVAEFLQKKQELINENRFLKEENLKLKEKLICFDSLKEENEELKQALETGLFEKFNLVAARASFQNPSEQIIIINKGQKDKIEKGMPVIVSGKTLIGVVKDVYAESSLVRLLTNSESKIAVKFGEQKTRAEASGIGEPFLVLSLIPREVEIKPGELVTTLGSGRKIPSGLLVGEIQSVGEGDVKPYQEAIITPPVACQDIDFVFLVLDY